MNDRNDRDFSDLSFTGDAPPERFAAPSSSRRAGGLPPSTAGGSPPPFPVGDPSSATQRFSRLRTLRARFTGRRTRLLVMALVLAGGTVALYYALREKPVFPLETVLLEGQTRLTADEALGLSGLEKGTNLLAIDAATAELAERSIAAALPFAKTVKIERALPKTLKIRIEERKPTLLVAAQHLYLADEDGMLYRRLQPGDKRALPVMTGLSRDDLQKRKKESEEAIRGAIALVKTLGGRCTEHIAYSEARGYSALLCNGPEVFFGKPPFNQDKLSRLERALHTTKRARVIHLDDERRPERVVVRIGRQGA